MGFFFDFFFFLLRVYIIVTCNLCQQIDDKGIHTSNSRTSEKLFILLYIYYFIFISLFFFGDGGGGFGGGRGRRDLLNYVCT